MVSRRIRWEGHIDQIQDERILLKENLSNQFWDMNWVHLAEDLVSSGWLM
jgi:hypothetical protein